MPLPSSSMPKLNRREEIALILFHMIYRSGDQGQFAVGGRDIRIASVLPPVFRPNWVPRS